MENKDAFIAQTAKDYDMDYETVERIFYSSGDDFYQKLEAYIKNR